MDGSLFSGESCTMACGRGVQRLSRMISDDAEALSSRGRRWTLIVFIAHTVSLLQDYDEDMRLCISPPPPAAHSKPHFVCMLDEFESSSIKLVNYSRNGSRSPTLRNWHLSESCMPNDRRANNRTKQV